MDYRIISIGALSRHELWGEKEAVRTPHATCTLVRSEDKVILVDPGLPPAVISARLQERAGLGPDKITHVFLTNFRPAHRWGIEAFAQAQWLIFENEREIVGRHLVERYRVEDEPEAKKLLEIEIALLKRIKPAPDKLAKQVDLFPLPGYTPGTCGLLLSDATCTTLLASDAVPTGEHLAQGRVLPGGFDLAQAQESFKEAVEIADILIPGHDNIVLNPGKGRL